MNSIAGRKVSQTLEASSVNCTSRIARQCIIFSPTAISIRNRPPDVIFSDALLAQVRRLPPVQINVYTSYLLPEGVLVVEEDVHKKQVSIDCMRNIWLVLITLYQRKIMVIFRRIMGLRFGIYLSFQNPAFGPAQLRALTEIFVEKSKQVNGLRTSSCLYLKRLTQLRDVWTARASTGGGVARVNVLPEFSTAALDIIGKAGRIPVSPI